MARRCQALQSYRPAARYACHHCRSSTINSVGRSPIANRSWATSARTSRARAASGSPSPPEDLSGCPRLGVVKRQYLLDERDFRKYGLLEDLVETRLFRRMALLWMLTPNDLTGQGQSRTSDESRPRLSAFFQRFEESEPACADVADHFRSFDVEVYSHELAYTTCGAAEYFADIPDRFLEDSIIFFDPDTGFEPARGPKDAHLRWADVATVWSRARGDSLIVVFQYAGRKSHEHLEALRATLHDRLLVETAAVRASRVRFFLAGSALLLNNVSEQLSRLAWAR
jgi:hypothetical protein